MSMLIPPDRIGRLCGFGMAVCADGYIYRPVSNEEIVEVFHLARRTGKKIVLRGAGRSYGDASILPEQIVLDISAMNQVIEWDPETGVFEVEAGFTIENLWRKVLPEGWWPPVVSGTMFPTLAGALAMNIHGKNNFAAGTLGEHVLELEVMTPSGEVLRVKRDNPLLNAFISSAGLLGVITRVKLQLKQVGSGMLRVLALSQRHWDDQFDCFAAHLSAGGETGMLRDDQGTGRSVPDYFVSWVDCFARGDKAGRGLIHAAWYDLDAPPPEKYDLPAKTLGLPKSEVWRILRFVNNRPGMRILNALKNLSGARFENGKEHVQSLVEFSFLLDYVPNWRKAYLPGGFIQYQSFLPKNCAKSVFMEQIRMQQAEGMEAFLGVMKRHRPDGFMFSHAVDGYSLALDFKVTPANRTKLWALCHRMNDLVLSSGGRFYFAKDATLRPADVEGYLGEEAMDCYRRLKAKFDPEGLLTSSLGQRLGL